MAGRRGSVKQVTERLSPSSAWGFASLSSSSPRPELSVWASPTGARSRESLAVSSGRESGTACSSCGCSDEVLPCFGSVGRPFKRRTGLSAAVIRFMVACSHGGRSERSSLSRSAGRRPSSARRLAVSSRASPLVRENGIGRERSTVKFRAESMLRSAVVTSHG